MTPNEIRQVLADALDRAAERLRAGIVTVTEPKRAADPNTADLLSDVVEHVLKVDDVARLLGVSTWSIYEAIKAGEMPAIRVGRRILVPTHVLRIWMHEVAGGRG